MSQPELSVVIPIYNEEQVLPELRRRLELVLQPLGLDYEIVLVNDGSADRSQAMMAGWASENGRVRPIELSRNFGHSAACAAGLDYSRGDVVLLMDGDLQDPPELLPSMLEKWREGFEVVYAERPRRAEPFARRKLIGMFHQVFRWMSDFPIPLHAGVFSLMDRRVVDELKRMPERNRFLPGLRSYVGFRVTKVRYDRPDRHAGQPKQTYVRLIVYGLDAIFSFSRKPLQASTLLGMIVASLSALYGLSLLLLRLFGVNVVPGFTTIAAGMFFLGGVQLISLGILGEYISRIYDEVKQRPLYIVREPHPQSAPGRQAALDARKESD